MVCRKPSVTIHFRLRRGELQRRASAFNLQEHSVPPGGHQRTFGYFQKKPQGLQWVDLGTGGTSTAKFRFQAQSSHEIRSPGAELGLRCKGNTVVFILPAIPCPVCKYSARPLHEPKPVKKKQWNRKSDDIYHPKNYHSLQARAFNRVR